MIMQAIERRAIAAVRQAVAVRDMQVIAGP